MKLPNLLNYLLQLLRRPSRDHVFKDLPAAYERSLIASRAYPDGPPRDIPNGLMLAFGAKFLRGGQEPPAFASLTSRELNAMETIYAIATFEGAEYAAFSRRLSHEVRPKADLLRMFVEGVPPAPASPEARLRERIRAVAEKPKAAPAQTQAPPPLTPFKQVEDLPDWLPGHGDPDLWHLLVGELNYGHEGTLKLVQWIVDQPQCDRATAALALTRLEAYNLLELQTMEDCKSWDGYRWSIARSVCGRSEADGYSQGQLNLSCLLEDDDQSGLLGMFESVADDVTAKGKTLPFPLPRKLLSRRFEGRAAVSADYVVNDDWLYRRAADGDLRVAATRP